MYLLKDQEKLSDTVLLARAAWEILFLSENPE